MLSSFPGRLKLAREKAELSQAQVMGLVNINNKTLSGYETGKSEPDIGTINILCDLYGISSDWLLGRSKMMNVYAKDKGYYIDLTNESFVSNEVIINHRPLTGNQKQRLLKMMRLFLED